jgi:hypothetical protein
MSQNPPIFIKNGSKGQQELFRNFCLNCGIVCYSFIKYENFLCNKICIKEYKRKQENEIQNKFSSRR